MSATRNEHAKRPSATKSGPGRYHADGTKKAGPVRAKGAPRGFVLHQAGAAKKLRREQTATMGRRQRLKADKRDRREPLPEGLAA